MIHFGCKVREAVVKLRSSSYQKKLGLTLRSHTGGLGYWVGFTSPFMQWALDTMGTKSICSITLIF